MRNEVLCGGRFCRKLFEGNPAGICILDKWLPDNLMQDIACENNLAETAFTVRRDSGYHLRWFTPGGEIELCGHATLAAVYILLRFYEPGADKISFQTKSGHLEVSCIDHLLEIQYLVSCRRA